MARTEEGLLGSITGTGLLTLHPELIAEVRRPALLAAHFGAAEELFWCEGDNVLLLAASPAVSLGLSLGCLSWSLYLAARK